jgi:putative tricarboxylic transport membrane protein
MRIRNGQDFATGLLFVAVGIAALWIGADYAMGTPQRPGTGVLPRILAWCLVGTGALLWLKALLADGPGLTGWAWRPLLAVTAGTVVFGLMIDDWGLVLSMVVAMAICALGTAETRWAEFAVFTLIMIASSWAMFIWLLGMPIRTWPTNVSFSNFMALVAPILR